MEPIVLRPFLNRAVLKPPLYHHHVPQARSEQLVTEGVAAEKATIRICPPGSQGEGAPAVTGISPVASQRCIRIPCRAKRTWRQARCLLQPLLSPANLSWPLQLRLS